MNDTTRSSAPTLNARTHQFNVNKLQAALCMAASAAVTVGLIVWAVLAWS